MNESATLKELVNGLTIHYDHAKEWHDETMRALRNNELNFDGYQKRAYEFAVYKDISYPILALAEEVGEISALFAKHVRRGLPMEEVDSEKLMDELSDVLWNLSALAEEFNIKLSDIARHNLSKLRTRKRNNTIKSR